MGFFIADHLVAGNAGKHHMIGEADILKPERCPFRTGESRTGWDQERDEQDKNSTSHTHSINRHFPLRAPLLQQPLKGDSPTSAHH